MTGPQQFYLDNTFIIDINKLNISPISLKIRSDTLYGTAHFFLHNMTSIFDSIKG